jgi:hypothetical protein
MSAKTTRIDFYLVNINAGEPSKPIVWGYMVRFFALGWDYWTTPYRTEIDPPMRMQDDAPAEPTVRPFDLDTTLAQLEQSGWTVRKWGASPAGVTGARAWRGQPQPVRTREQIIAMRRRQSARLLESQGQPEPAFTTFIDYAYEG